MILQGFGTSMSPFFRPGEELEVKPFEDPAIRPGDVLVFQTQDRSYSIESANFPAQVTHRLVRKLRVGDQRVYLTKGDNRLLFDPVVFPDQIVGRVIRAGRKNLTRGIWRRTGRVLAEISYLQAILFQWWMGVPFNGLGGFRWSEIHRKQFLQVVRRILHGPLPALEAFSNAVGRQIVAGTRGIRVEPWDSSAIEEMAQVWNRSFPKDGTTSERLEKRLFSSPDFDPSQCKVVYRRGRLVGWGFSAVIKMAGGRWIRRVERIALLPEEWRSGTADVLFHRLGSSHPAEFPEVTEWGWMPVQESREGFLLSSEAELAARYGFQPVFLLTLMRFPRERGQEFQRKSLRNGVSVRLWEEGDEGRLQREFQAPEYDEQLVTEYFKAGGRPDRVLLAIRDGQIAGISFWLPDEEARSTAQLGGWVWSVAQPPVRRGYGFHVVVDERHRSQGIGSAMIAEGSRRLFEEGCDEVLVWTRAEPVFERAGYLPQRKFLRMRRTSS